MKKKDRELRAAANAIAAVAAELTARHAASTAIAATFKMHRAHRVSRLLVPSLVVVGPALTRIPALLQIYHYHVASQRIAWNVASLWRRRCANHAVAQLRAQHVVTMVAQSASQPANEVLFPDQVPNEADVMCVTPVSDAVAVGCHITCALTYQQSLIQAHTPPGLQDGLSPSETANVDTRTYVGGGFPDVSFALRQLRAAATVARLLKRAVKLRAAAAVAAATRRAAVSTIEAAWKTQLEYRLVNAGFHLRWSAP